MKARPMLYMAHPIAGDVPTHLASALKWLAFLRRQYQDVVIVAPYIATIMAGEDDNDPAQRARGLEDGCEVVRRCNGVILVRALSRGMRIEATAALELGHPVYDMTQAGLLPPDEGRVSVYGFPPLEWFARGALPPLGEG